MPRFKRIHAQKQYRPASGKADSIPT
ncbi:MAG: hypothetical protein H7249_15735 [Chitinophagaceae bacterium]|nr:hypothetical protein [Oligoflexus sp.]